MTSTVEIGKWYVDGFCLNHIITPVKSDKHIGGIKWEPVRACLSHEQAEKEVKEYNENRLLTKQELVNLDNENTQNENHDNNNKHINQASDGY